METKSKNNHINAQNSFQNLTQDVQLRIANLNFSSLHQQNKAHINSSYGVPDKNTFFIEDCITQIWRSGWGDKAKYSFMGWRAL
jgi:hypothetical protein